MNDEDIVKLAYEAGISELVWFEHGSSFQKFARLVCLAEQDRIQNIIDDMKQQLIDMQIKAYDQGVADCEKAIMELIESKNKSKEKTE